MMYACKKCGKRTKIPRPPRLHLESGGLLRKRHCTACHHEVETLENERGTYNKIVERMFRREYGVLLDELRAQIAELRKLLPVAPK
jgi:hypothetical protein